MFSSMKISFSIFVFWSAAGFAQVEIQEMDFISCQDQGSEVVCVDTSARDADSAQLIMQNRDQQEQVLVLRRLMKPSGGTGVEIETQGLSGQDIFRIKWISVAEFLYTSTNWEGYIIPIYYNVLVGSERNPTTTRVVAMVSLEPDQQGGYEITAVEPNYVGFGSGLEALGHALYIASSALSQGDDLSEGLREDMLANPQWYVADYQLDILDQSVQLLMDSPEVLEQIEQSMVSILDLQSPIELNLE